MGMFGGAASNTDLVMGMFGGAASNTDLVMGMFGGAASNTDLVMGMFGGAASDTHLSERDGYRWVELHLVGKVRELLLLLLHCF